MFIPRAAWRDGTGRSTAHGSTPFPVPPVARLADTAGRRP